jgi:hypothetical protein
MVLIIATTRFNETTWNENVEWRRQNDWEGCIYGTPKRMGATIPPEVDVVVLEMHNDENRIKGVGLTQNKVFMREQHRIYNQGNYNRYIYKGANRVDRDDMTNKEEKIMRVFDVLLFKGSRHLKRGHGIIRLPQRIVATKHIDVPEFFNTMIKSRQVSKNSCAEHPIVR